MRKGGGMSSLGPQNRLFKLVTGKERIRSKKSSMGRQSTMGEEGRRRSRAETGLKTNK